MAISPNTLFEEAKCLECYSSASMAEALKLALMQRIAEAEAARGNLSGAGSPMGVVTPDSVNQFYRDTVGNVLWQSIGLTNTDWLQWIP